MEILLSQKNVLIDVVAEDVELDVRHFRVREGLSQLFDIEVECVCTDASLDLDTIVGYGAALRLAVDEHHSDSDLPGYRVWGGLCIEAEHVGVAENGLSSYRLRIAPMLWRTTQRTSRRIFQNQTATAIATSVLSEWGIDAQVDVDESRGVRCDYRVQLDESDYAFMCRQLESQGIAFGFEFCPPKEKAETDTGDQVAPHARMKLRLGDHPERWREQQDTLSFVGDGEDKPDKLWAAKVRLGRLARAGRVSLRGYDFRASSLELAA